MKHIQLNMDKCICLHLNDDRVGDKEDEDVCKQNDHNHACTIRLLLEKCTCRLFSDNCKFDDEEEKDDKDDEFNNDNYRHFDDRAFQANKDKNNNKQLKDDDVSSLCKQCVNKERCIQRLSDRNGCMKIRLTEVENENVKLRLKLEKYKKLALIVRHQVNGRSSASSSSTSSMDQDLAVNVTRDYSKINLKALRERCDELEEINVHLNRHLSKLRASFVKLGLECAAKEKVAEVECDGKLVENDKRFSVSSDSTDTLISIDYNFNSLDDLDSNISSSKSSIKLSEIDLKSEFELWFNSRFEGEH